MLSLDRGTASVHFTYLL